MGEIQHNMIFKLVKEERTITNIIKGGRNYECLLSKISGSVLSSAKMMRGEDRAEFV